MSDPRFKISKPSTTSDDGSPSASCLEDVRRTFRLIEDERHLVAHALYHDVLDRIRNEQQEEPTASGAMHQPKQRLRFRKSKNFAIKAEKAQDFQAAQELIESKKDVLDDLDKRCQLFAKARDNVLDDNQWTLAQTMFGITTYYRTEQDGSLSIKMEGRLEGVSLFDQVAVLREVDLHYKWAPFCSSSLTVAHLNKLDTVGWFVVGLPTFGLMRDACFRAIGCDSMLEDGSILLVAQGIADKPECGLKKTTLTRKSGADSSTDRSGMEVASEFEYLSKDPVLEKLDIPDPPCRIGSGRMTIRAFQSLINVDSPTSARTRIIANVDPNLPLIPQSLLDFLMKRLCGVLLNKLQNAAKRVSKDPINNPHASKMRQEEEFYKNWLMVKFQGVCDLRNWKMPPVTSFELSDAQMELARDADEKKNKGRATKTLKQYHSLSDDRLRNFIDKDNASEPANVGQRNPKVRAMSSGDDSIISDISRNSSSSSVWQNNPISTYMRELEEKTQMRKAREIQRERARAASRLKPKELDEEAKNRLGELRLAREGRLAGIKANQPMHIPLDSTQSQRRLIKSRYRKDWATMWTNHGHSTKLTVLTILVILLFGFLYSDKIVDQYISDPGHSFWSKRIQDLTAIVFMGVCAALHFLLCYVTLMYAFLTLQIGAIAGTQAKRFYSQNIHLVLAISSSSMVALSITHAAMIVVLRWLIWEISLLFTFFTGIARSSLNQLLGKFPDSIVSTGTIVAGYAGQIGAAFTAAVIVGRRILEAFQAFLFDSTMMGRSIWVAMSTIFQPSVTFFTGLRSFVNSSIESYEGHIEVPVWREDAFRSTRYLLAHSGVFLLVLVALFNLSARRARCSFPSHPQDDSSTVDADSTLGSDYLKNRSADVPALQESNSDTNEFENKGIRPIADHSRSRAVTWSSSPQFDTIDEASEDKEDSSVQCRGSSAKKRRGSRWFGRRKEKGAVQHRSLHTAATA